MNTELENFIMISQKILESKRYSLNESKDRLIAFINEHIIKKIEENNIIVQDRVKGSESLREKIIRKSYFYKYKDKENDFIDELPDLIGVRLVCLLEREEKIVYDKLKDVFCEKINSDDEYYVIKDNNLKLPYLKIKLDGQPDTQNNGYYIYKMDAKWVDGDNITNAELQIKSLVHTFWGEIEHMLFYKNYSYVMNKDFYGKIMDSTYNILHNVDYQLEAMEEQLKLKNNLEEVKEIQEIGTRILYTTYQPDVHKIYKCNIDLREAFEFISLIYFENSNNKNVALNTLNQLIMTINSRNGQLVDENLVFSKYNENDTSLNKFAKEWAEELKVLINGEDIFWKTFFAVYKLVKQNNDTTALINEISNYIVKMFSSYRDDFEDGIETMEELCCDAINTGIIKIFKQQPKIRFFIDDNIKNKVLNVAKKFVDKNQAIISGLNNKEYQECDIQYIFIYISEVIRVQGLFVFQNKIEKEEIKRLIEIVEYDIIGNFGLDNEKLKDYYESNELISSNELDEIFNNRGEE